MQLDNHNEYNNTLFFHGQTQNVFSDHFYEYIICHIGYKDTLTPQELIWYVYLNDDLDVFLTPVIFIILKWRWQNSRLQDGWMDADRALFWKSHLNDLFFVTKTKDT